MRQRIFLPEPTLEDFLTVLAQSPCAVACINVCTRVKNPKHWQPYHCSWHTKMLHPLVGMGSTACSCSGCNDPNFLKGLMNYYYKKASEPKRSRTHDVCSPAVTATPGGSTEAFLLKLNKELSKLNTGLSLLACTQIALYHWGQGRSANPNAIHCQRHNDSAVWLG